MARTHVVMSDELLSAIDKVVGERGRSRFLEEAATEKLARLDLERALRTSSGVARGSSYKHWADRASAAEWVRKGRRSTGRP